MENITDLYCEQKITRDVRDDSFKKGYYVFSSRRGTGDVYYKPSEIARRIANVLLFKGSKGEFLVKGVRLNSVMFASGFQIVEDVKLQERSFLYATRDEVFIRSSLDADLEDMKEIQSELVKILSQSL